MLKPTNPGNVRARGEVYEDLPVEWAAGLEAPKEVLGLHVESTL